MTQPGTIAIMCAVLAATLASACKTEERRAEPGMPSTATPPAAIPSAATPSTAAPPAAAPTTPGTTPGEQGGAGTDPDLATVTVTVVDIDTKLAAMCGVPDSKVYFKYDSAKLGPEAKDHLDEIARCAKTGAIKDQELIVVGRTDPAGPDSYNQQLGMSRAEAVARYLREQGVSKARVETASKGEAAASADPWHWPWDRRVTIRLRQ